MSTWSDTPESVVNPRVYRTRLRVRNYELDAQGHVNHAVYLNYFEHGRVNALEQAGMPWERFMERGILFGIVRAEVDYRREARLGERLVVTTLAERVGNSSMTFRQRILKAGDDGAADSAAHDSSSGAEPRDSSAESAERDERAVRAERAERAAASEQVIAEARIVGVCIGRDGKPRRVPEELRRVIE